MLVEQDLMPRGNAGVVAKAISGLDEAEIRASPLYG